MEYGQISFEQRGGVRPITLSRPQRLLKEAMLLAERLAAGPPLATQLTHRALGRSAENTLLAQLTLEWAGQAVCLASEDAREGIRAWAEKRTPVWRGR